MNMGLKKSYRATVFRVTFHEAVSVVEFVKEEAELEMERAIPSYLQLRADADRFRRRISDFEAIFKPVFKTWKQLYE